MILHWLVIITYKFEVLGYAGLCWPSLAFLAFVALDIFLKQKLAFVDKIQAQLTCFQQSDVKTNYQTRSGILKHCGNVGTVINCFLDCVYKSLRSRILN